MSANHAGGGSIRLRWIGLLVGIALLLAIGADWGRTSASVCFYMKLAILLPGFHTLDGPFLGPRNPGSEQPETPGQRGFSTNTLADVIHPALFVDTRPAGLAQPGLPLGHRLDLVLEAGAPENQLVIEGIVDLVQLCLAQVVGLLGRRGEVIAIASIVLFRQKARLAVIAALNDVLGNTQQGKAGFSGQGSPPCERAGCNDNEAIGSVGYIREKPSLTRIAL